MTTDTDKLAERICEALAKAIENKREGLDPISILARDEVMKELAALSSLPARSDSKILREVLEEIKAMTPSHYARGHSIIDEAIARETGHERDVPRALDPYTVEACAKVAFDLSFTARVKVRSARGPIGRTAALAGESMAKEICTTIRALLTEARHDPRDQLIAEAVKALKLTTVELENLFAMVQGEVPSLLEDHHSYSEIVEALKIANATLAKLKGLDQAQHPANVPDGWQLVPIEITDHMRAAALQTSIDFMNECGVDKLSPFVDYPSPTITIERAYRAMLAAAPNPTRTEG